ncbi:MAG: hypothetical protein JW941_03055 [Candidatus Coatesbacteria bacterium]|nr:hypothetical protein [Candidatus Coatesbacteria bacterium]
MKDNRVRSMRYFGLITSLIAAMLCTAIPVVGEEKGSDADSLPPFTWDHFPPRQASNVFPTADIAFKVTDSQTGPRPSSVFVTIDGDRAFSQTFKMDEGGKTLLVICPNSNSFGVGQVLTVTIDAEDYAGNMMSRDYYHLTTCAAAPRMNCGGFMFSDLSPDGGKLMLAADIAAPMCGIGDIGVYLGLDKIGLQLRDDGTNGDLIADDGIWMTELDFGAGLIPGDVLLSILAIDSAGYAGFAWPFLGSTYDFIPDPYPPFSEWDSYRWTAVADAYLAKEGPLDGYKPVVLSAGYWNSFLFEHGGYLYMAAQVLDPDGPDAIASVGVYDRDGNPTGLYMNDEGYDGDVVPGDGIYTTTYPILLGAEANRLHLFRVLAINQNGYASDPWPFLRIHE